MMARHGLVTVSFPPQRMDASKPQVHIHGEAHRPYALPVWEALTEAIHSESCRYQVHFNNRDGYTLFIDLIRLIFFLGNALLKEFFSGFPTSLPPF